jgi:hypothetical protein
VILTPTPTLTIAGAITLDADGNGALGPLTDGLLFLRHLFGFTGPALITGAVVPGCTRCTGPEIAGYIASLGSTIDIDADGQVGPLTDGLLILRYLFGFTGPALVNGATGPLCTRCDAASIVAYLQTID